MDGGSSSMGYSMMGRMRALCPSWMMNGIVYVYQEFYIYPNTQDLFFVVAIKVFDQYEITK
jgi:hypothetical protein